MAELKALAGTLSGLEISLDEGEVWTLGRDPDESSIVLEDRKVSRKHVVCTKTSEGILVENLSRTNPAKLNDEPLIEPKLLKEGDRLTIGGTVFVFHDTSTPSFEMGDSKEEEFEEVPEVHFDLSGSSRFILKVVSGPNTGAEIALDLGKSYLIGTDTASCDIVFHDISISRQHARLEVHDSGDISIEDLGSKNGVLIRGDKVEGNVPLPPNAIVTLGTSSFLVIDKEAPLTTIAAPIYQAPKAAEEIEDFEEQEALASETKSEEIAPTPLPMAKKPVQPGFLILSLMLLGLVVLLGVGMVSLFKEKDVEHVQENQVSQLHNLLKQYPAVKYTFNEATGRLFLIGHVSTGVEKGELLYNLRTLCFIRGIDDHIVDDEAIWQEMNLLLIQNPNFSGVSMHSPEAGRFVVSGYIGTSKEAAALNDYLNLHFTYLDLLDNCVVVVDEVLDEVRGHLFQKGFNGVTAEFSNGTLTLTGYIPTADCEIYANLSKQFEEIWGVRSVKNFAVLVAPEHAVVDLNERNPGRYVVTGYSKHGDVNVNVVINGKILMRGDCIDGMVVTSIQTHTVFLEKDGLKYKLGYNDCH